VKPGPDPADTRLWAIVAATVRPLAGRVRPPITQKAVSAKSAPPRKSPAPPPSPASTPNPPRRTERAADRPPEAIEPGRHRRLTRERDSIAARIDLHGLNQDLARQALTNFLLRAHVEGRRSILVITGKGALGDGILRRRVPDWLGQAPLRAIVAGLSEAHRRHGGEGALYVALKRSSGL